MIAMQERPIAPQTRLRAAVRRRQRRRWSQARQAYTPRLWPTYLSAFAIAVAAHLVMLAVYPAAAWTGGVWGTVIAVAIAETRDRLWKRKHPPLTPAEYHDVMRAWAPFN